jgi:hypothetical protein
MSEVTTHNGTAPVQAPPAAPAAPVASKAKIDEYKERFVKLDDKVTVTKEAYDKAVAARSELCEKFAKECGKGKYKIREEILTLTSRKSKGGDTVTYYMKGKTDDEEVR